MVMKGTIYFALNLASSFVTFLQITQSLLVSDYRTVLATRGDVHAAKRILLPCYRPLLITLIYAYLLLCLYQGLCFLIGIHFLSNQHFVYFLVRLYGFCLLAIYSIIPVLLIQKSVSFRGFWKSFFMIVPLWIVGCVILSVLLVLKSTDISASFGIIVLLQVIFALLVIPAIILSVGILAGYIHCRVRLKSVSNRNVIELLLLYSFIYFLNIVTGIVLNDVHGFRDPDGFVVLTLIISLSSIFFNALFPFALYRGLLADTKFWRGLGKHNQGGISIDAADTTRDSEVKFIRPVAQTIDIRTASYGFQSMMADIGKICLDFALVQVDRLIGHGATSEVYCGRFNNVLVAIKVSTPPEITIDVLNEFAKEAKICSALKHPNIVLFYGICVRPPQIGMVFELCEGGNLKGHLLKHSSKWSRSLRVRACWQCAEAVAYLHNKGYIHRDIKAENFLVTRKLIVKLGDFGETTRIPNETTKRMTILGTVSHMAPELIYTSKKNTYTEAVDIFALAMTFIEIWTGGDLYNTLSHFQIYDYVEKGGRPELPMDAPQPLRHIISSAWQEDYRQRPNGAKIASELKELFSDMTGLMPKPHTSTNNDSIKGNALPILKSINILESIPELVEGFDEDTPDYTPKELHDPSASGYMIARLILKMRSIFRIPEYSVEADTIVVSSKSPVSEFDDTQPDQDHRDTVKNPMNKINSETKGDIEEVSIDHHERPNPREPSITISHVESMDDLDRDVIQLTHQDDIEL